MSKTSKGQSKWERYGVYIDILALIVAVIAIGISLNANRIAKESNRIAKESNTISETGNELAEVANLTAMNALSQTIVENERNEERWEKQHALNKVALGVDISVKYYIADSPDFSAEKDKDWRALQSFVSLKKIETDYQFVEGFQYEPEGDVGKKYLFIVFINEGPGIAEEVNITSFKWTPKENEPIPLEREFKRDLGPLEYRAAYALLVDVFEEATDVKSGNVSSFQSYLKANVNFEMIELTLKFKDLLGEEEVSPPYYLSRSDETLEDLIKIEPMLAPGWFPEWSN